MTSRSTQHMHLVTTSMCAWRMYLQKLSGLLKAGAPPILVLCILLLASRAVDLTEIYDCGELFAGDHAVSTALRDASFTVFSMDIKYTQNSPRPHAMNINTPAGFALALWGLLRMRPRGLLVMAPVCSSWVFLSRSTTQRSKTAPLGSDNVTCVEEGNLMVARCALLALICRWKNVT
jgi:hypothetical protein